MHLLEIGAYAPLIFKNFFKIYRYYIYFVSINLLNLILYQDKNYVKFLIIYVYDFCPNYINFLDPSLNVTLIFNIQLMLQSVDVENHQFILFF